VTLAIFSLSGRRISKSIVTVKKSQWVSLQKTGAGIQGTLARGPLLYWLSFGDIQKQGFIHAQQGRQLEVQIEN
jgi:hypothetical protein